MVNMFVYCYFGKLTNESYEQMNDCIKNRNWYELPIGLQKHFIFIIVNMQKPVYYHGFGVVDIDLELFMKVKYISYNFSQVSN